MEPRLTKYLKTDLTPYDLLDPSLRPAPLQNNHWALWCAWVLDWIVAYTLVKLSLSSWNAFVAPLGLETLPIQVQQYLKIKSNSLGVLLAPVFYFTLSYVGLYFHGKTLGQKLFRHHVQFEKDADVAWYAAFSTVALVLAGWPVLTMWCDLLANSQTVSDDYGYHVFSSRPNVEESPVKLVEGLATETLPSESNDVDWPQAA